MSEINVKVKVDDSELTNLEQRLQKDKATVDVKVNGSGDVEKVTKNVDNMSAAVQKSSTVFGNLQSKMSSAWATGAKYITTYKGLQLIAQAGKKAVQSVVDIDKAITDLRMATGDSYDNVSRLVSQYNQFGKELGATTTEVTSSADAWLRQGHSIEDTNKLIRNSMVLSKVASIDSAEATDYLTSAMKGYKLAVDDVAGVTDKLTSVDLVSATDAGGLAEAMARCSVTADMAGISMDKLLGYLAVTGEVSQRSMSSVGEAYKSILTRMSDIKANKLELVDDDGTVEYLSDVERTLAGVGINLRSTMDEYNNYGDVLDSLAGKWNSLSDVQRNAISKSFAGVRQAEYFRILMENYDTAKQYMEVAANSAGTAEAKFAAYTESIEAKLKSLQATFESLATNTISGDLVKNVLSGSQAFLEFLDKTNLVQGSLAGVAVGMAITGFQKLGSVVKTTAKTMSDFYQALQLVKAGNLGENDIKKLGNALTNMSDAQQKAVLSSKALTTQQRIAILEASGMSTAEAEAALATMGLATAEGVGTTMTFSLTAAIRGLWATLMANPLILIVAGVTAAVSVFSHFKQKAEEASQAVLDAGNSAKESASNIRDLYSAYESAVESKEGLTEATDALLSALGVEEAELSELIGKYGDLDTAINNVTVDALRQDLADLTAAYSESIDKLLDTTENGLTPFNMLHFNGRKESLYTDILDNAGLMGFLDGGGNIYVGDNTTVEGIVAMYDKLTKMRDALESNIGEMYTREDLMESSLYNGINDKLASFKDDYDEVLGYINEINKTASQIQLIGAMDDSIPQTTEEFEKFKQQMIDTAKASGQFVGSEKDIEDAVINTMATLPELSAFFEHTAESAESAGDTIAEAAANAISGVITISETVNKLTSSIQAAQDVLGSQSTGKSLSLTDWNSDDLTDYRSALEYVNGSLQFNADKVNEIIQAKSKEQIAVNNSNKAYTQSQYLANASEIEKLRAKIRDNTYATDENAESVQLQIDSYLAQNDTLRDTINTYDVMNASITDATSAYQNWLNAQSAAQSGDMFDSTLEAFQKINDTINNTDSEDYGRIGNQDYKMAVDFVVPDTVDKTDTDAVNSYMNSINDLFTFDDDGNRDGLNIVNFCEKAVKEGLMYLDEESEEYKIAGQTTMEDFAEGLGLSLPLVQAMFGEMEEFGAEFSWADEANKTIGDLGVSATEAAEKLRSIDDISDLTIQLDVSDLESKEEKLSALDATIEEMNGVKAKVDVDSSEAEYANEVISYCVAQKQMLSQPEVMQVDVSLVEGKLGEAIRLLQEFQKASEQLQVQQALGLDTSQAESNLDAVTQKIQGLDSNVTTTLNIDTSSVDSIQQSISNLTCDMLVTAGVDDTAIIGFQQEAHDAKGTVKWDNNTVLVDSYSAAQKSASGTVKWYNDTALVKTEFTAKGTINWSGGQVVNGTAHASGTAKANGDWGTAQGGTTLVGELGQEIVVDPRTGRWYTVGDNGAEFRNIPNGAIVFNHKQTESLLEYGYVAGRASALVSGTAMVTGGIKKSQASKSSGGSKSSSKKKSSSSKSSSKNSSSKSKSSSSSKEKDFEETLDWIEVKIDRIERAIDSLDLKASSVYKSWSSRNANLSKEISQVGNEIAIQQAGYNRYLKQANSVGLSESWAKKVRDGLIDINTITDETLSKQISSYTEWHEKALDCKKAIEELKETQSDLGKSIFENIGKQYDNILSIVEHEQNMIEEYINQSEEHGYITSIKYYQALQKTEQTNLADLQKKKASLTAEMNELVGSGLIQKNTEAWYEMCNQIDDVTLAIEEGNTALIEYANNIRDIKWEIFDLIRERVSNVASEAEFLNKILEENDLFRKGGQLTGEGYATMGLHAVDYDIYMAQADEYKKEMLAVSAELAKDPANQDLADRRQELLELQQDMILAAQDEKDAIIDMVHDGIELELDALKDLIDSYNDALDSSRDLYSYQKKVKDQTSDIASLQKQITAYQGDTSEETRATVQKLQVSMADAKDALEETQYDKYIADQKQLLDELYLNYETNLNKRFDNIDALFADMIASVNSNSDTIASTLHSVTENVGYSMTDEMNNIWQEAYTEQQEEALRRAEQASAILTQLISNGQISSEDAKNILDILGSGNDLQAKNAADQVQRLVDNGTITQETGLSIISSLSSATDQAAAQNALSVITQLENEGKISTEQSKQIRDAIITGDANDKINASNIIGQLLANGEMSVNNATDIISAMNEGNNTETADALAIVQKLAENGEISTADVNRIVQSLVTGDEQALQNSNAIIQKLEDQGLISSMDALTIKDALSAVQQATADSGKNTKDIVATYGKDFGTKITTTNETLAGIKADVDAIVTKLNAQAQTKTATAAKSSAAKSTSTTTAKTTTTKKTPAKTTTTQAKKWGWWFKAQRDSFPKSKLNLESIVDRLKFRDIASDFNSRKYYYGQMGGAGGSNAYQGTAAQNLWMVQMLKAHGYRKGLRKSDNDELAWTQEGRNMEAIIRPSDGAILTPLAKGDSVLSAAMTDNIWNMANDPSRFIKDNLGSVNFKNQSNGSYNGDISVNVTLPNVENYEQFKYQMQHDKNFETFIRSISVDRMFGGSKLKKYKV